MNCLLDKITDDEYNMMKHWRDWYAWQESQKEKPISIKELLKIAYEPSKQLLYQLLGNNLKISENFEYSRESDELVRELTNVLDKKQSLGRVERNGYEFIRNFRAWYTEHYPIVHSCFDWSAEDWEELPPEVEEQNRINNEIINGFINMINYYSLVMNVYEGDSFEITLANGKPYRISKGCKPVKALAKIADSFGIEGFEEFRICHSQVLNQKSLKGTITLSIHPFDYWTMSDNECGWDSCMNWRDTGGYRQGTVEMMNSPCVVVAYMESSEPMEVLRTYGENGDNQTLYWNSKKWRQLFIVDEDVILGIKSYPYNNDELSLKVIEWLRELAEKNLGWTYYADEDNKPFRYINPKTSYSPKSPDSVYCFDFYSNCMYTDVGCADWHPMYIGTKIEDHYVKHANDRYLVSLNYSGATQCVSCGGVDINLYDESSLCCESCDSAARCSECGERIYDDDGYEFEGALLCEYCYNDRVIECECCEETRWKDDIHYVNVILPVSETLQEQITNNYGRTIPENGKVFAVCSSTLPTCDECLTNGNFVKRFLKEGKEPMCYTDNSYFNEPRYFVMASDLNEHGREYIPELGVNNPENWDEVWYDSFCYPKVIQPINYN